MTLVPNHLQPLNGSRVETLSMQKTNTSTYLRLMCALLFLVMTTTSCGLFNRVDNTTGKKDKDKEQPQGEDELLDPIEGTVVYNPETGQYDTVRVLTQKMDTLIWRDISTNDAPVITSDGVFVDEGGTLDGTGNFGTEYYSSYNVTTMLPFVTNKFSYESSSLPENSDWAVHFYGGMRMALDVLDQEGVGLNVTVLDTKGQTSEVTNLLRTNDEITNAHLLMGPYRKENVKLVADYAQRENKTFVSPYSASTGITNRNPNYIQVNPTLESHAEAIMQHARKTYRTDQVVLVTRDKPAEKARMEYFQQENYRIDGATTGPRLREFVISDDTPDLNKTEVKPYITLGTTTVFVIPSWSSEAFIGAFLRKIYIEARYSPIVVYGMPQWLDFNNIDYDVFENLNVHLSSSSFIDPYSPKVQEFKRRFFDRYGVTPNEEAFMGYDDMLYFGRMLKKYGTKFQFFLDQSIGTDYLHTQFKVNKVLDPQSMRPESRTEVIEKFENKYVNILKFDQYQFQLAN